jgi:ABC-type phosphate transport system substrate-binding protein
MHNGNTRRRARLARRLAALMGTALIIASGALMVSPVARAAEGRALTVTPNEELERQVVQVSWTGFTPTRPDGSFAVIILQCSAQPVTLGDCFTAEPFPQPSEGNRILGFTGEDGSGAASFEARAAKDLPSLDCSSTNPCSVLAYENDGVAPPLDGLPATAAVALLEFARNQADCPAVTDFDVRADGSSSSAPLFYRWAAARCTGDDAQVIDYTETSSTTGRENFLAGLVDVGLTSVPASQAELDAHPDRPEFAYAPIDLTAIAIVFNMKDPFTGRRIDDLVLSPRLITRLVTNSNIESWLNDPELRRLNPTTRFPSTSLAKPLLRAERDGDSRFVTDWMTSANDAKDFLAGRDRFQVPVNLRYRDYQYPVESFEAVDDGDAAYLPRTGQSQIALRMFYGVSPTGTLPSPTELYGFIGVVDVPTAQRFGLPTARIINAAGEAVRPTPESIAAGFDAMSPTEAGTLVPNFDSIDPDAYPLVKVDYAMVPTAPASDEQAGHIRSLLEFAVGDGQDLLPAGFIELPDALRDTTRNIASGLVGPAASTTTTATTTTTTVPFDPNCCGDGGYYDDGNGFDSSSSIPSFTATSGPKSTTTSLPSATTKAVTTTTVYTGTSLPMRGERMGVAMMAGAAGLSLVGWASGGAANAARATRRRRARRGVPQPGVPS